MRRLRLAILADCLRSPATRGYTRYTLNLLEDLRAADVAASLDVILISSGPIAERWSETISWTERIECRPKSRIAWRHLRLPFVLAQSKADVLFVPTNYGAPLWSPVPRIITVHDPFTHDALNRVSWRRGLRLRVEIATHRVVMKSQTTHLITISKTMFDAIRGRHWVPEDRLHWAYQRVAVGSKHDDVTQYTKGQNPGRDGPPMGQSLLYVGGFESRKNIPGLLRAMAILHELSPTTNLLLVGNTSGAQSELERLIAKNGLDTCVTIHGDITDEQLAELYARAHILVNPSFEEGFGLPVAEAMLNGCIPVVSAGGSMEEVVGRRDLCFDPYDPISIASVLYETLSRPDAETVRRHLEMRASSLFTSTDHRDLIFAVTRRLGCAS